jgi:hypothetical protein
MKQKTAHQSLSLDWCGLQRLQRTKGEGGGCFQGENGKYLDIPTTASTFFSSYEEGIS